MQLIISLAAYVHVHSYTTPGDLRCYSTQNLFYEEFEDTKGAIRIRISKKNRQHNGQKKKHKRTNNNLQNIHIKQKIEQHEPH